MDAQELFNDANNKNSAKTQKERKKIKKHTNREDGSKRKNNCMRLRDEK